MFSFFGRTLTRTDRPRAAVEPAIRLRARRDVPRRWSFGFRRARSSCVHTASSTSLSEYRRMSEQKLPAFPSAETSHGIRPTGKLGSTISSPPTLRCAGQHMGTPMAQRLFPRALGIGGVLGVGPREARCVGCVLEVRSCLDVLNRGTPLLRAPISLTTSAHSTRHGGSSAAGGPTALAPPVRGNARDKRLRLA